MARYSASLLGMPSAHRTADDQERAAVIRMREPLFAWSLGVSNGPPAGTGTRRKIHSVTYEKIILTLMQDGANLGLADLASKPDF